MEINTNDWVYRHRPPGIPTDIKIRIVEALTDGGYLVGGGESSDMFGRSGPLLILRVDPSWARTDLYVDGSLVLHLMNSDLYIRVGEFTDYKTETKLAIELKAISKMRDMSIEEGCLMKLEEMVMNLQEFFNKERENNEEQ